MDYWERQKLIKQFEQQANITLGSDFYTEEYLKKTNYDVNKAVFNFKQKVKELIEITGVTEQRATEILYGRTNFEFAVSWALKQQEKDNKYKQTEKSKTIEENITAFVGYTDVSRDIAQQYLNRSNNDITLALQMQKADKEKKQKENLEQNEQNKVQNKQFIETNVQYNQQQGNQQIYNYNNQAQQGIESKQFQNSKNQTTMNDDVETKDNNYAQKTRQPENQNNYLENINAFIGYTNASQEIAQQYLNSTNNNITNALIMYKTDQENVLKQNQERDRLNIEQKVNQEDSLQYSNNTNYNLYNQAPQANQQQFQNSQYQTTTNDDVETKDNNNFGQKTRQPEKLNQHQSTPPPPERQISPNKQNPVIRPPTPKTGFFGIKKEEEIASFQEKYLCEPKNANKVQTVSFAVRNGTQLVQFIQNKNPKLILKHQIEQLNEIQESVQIQVNEAEKQELNQIVQQYLIGQFQNAGTQQKVQQGYQQNVANAQQQQPQQQQNVVNFQSQLPNQFNQQQYGYNQFTKYQQQGPLQAVIAPVQQFNQNQNVTNVPLQARPMTPQGQNPIMQQQVPQYAENLGQSIQQRPVSRGQPNYAQDNQFVQTLPQAPVFNQGRPMSPVNLQFVQPILQNNVNRPMTPQSQASYQLMQQQQSIQNYQQQNYNQFQQQNPAAFPQNRPLTPSYYANNQINQAQQQAPFQPQYQQNNTQPQVLQNQVSQQIPNPNQMNQNLDLQQQIVQYAQMQTAPFQQSAEQQKVIQKALFQQQFQNSVPVLQLKNE
ncbi:Hypothetical_protein [Hexamita inflata]|uniref:Hypothetical_protein n=1 Tax=Hexamita inflata TaxID=28002 RepID=A0AA86RIK5_9EUKA|nr:Hypothetical protein HINF_LOCUS60682 [Hexamita inflata]